MLTVKYIPDPDERRQICADIIATLPNWFGLPDANTAYIEGVGTKDAFVIFDDDDTALGMLSLAHPYPTNADIYWMGILPEHHRRGIGEALFTSALARAKELGCESMTVETLSDTDPDLGYARTRQYYKAMGFKPMFELRPHGDDNPLLYMVKRL